MTGTNRRKYLMEIVEEYLEAGIGRYHQSELIDKLIEDGHTTYEEIGRDFGVTGFYRNIIRPVTKKRDASGHDRYLPTKTGGWVQPELADLEEMVWVYYERRHHVAAAEERLQKLRQKIIDQHGVDPDTLPDPTGGEASEDSDGDLVA